MGRLVFYRGGVIVTIGVVIGLAAAMLLGPLMAHMLYGVSPHEPFALLVGPMVLGVVALSRSGCLPVARWRWIR